MAKFCSPCVVLLLLFTILRNYFDNVPMEVEGKTCTISQQGCETEEDCSARCSTKYPGGLDIVLNLLYSLR
ncbi:hypothetical protein MKX01_005732 [Papaver californicum]|nr:hypothetical protein MKX01_005732 [Papaver californicum]